MLIPKFEWDDGSVHTLTPTYPPTQKVPVDKRAADREDDFTGEGVGQWTVNRVDRFRTLLFESVPEAQLSEWEAFIDWAIEGNFFKHYPDATSGTFVLWTMEDKEWDPQPADKTSEGRLFTFPITMRRYVTP